MHIQELNSSHLIYFSMDVNAVEINDCCFSSEIQLYRKTILYAEIVNGKGIVKFIDNCGNYWRFLDYKE